MLIIITSGANNKYETRSYSYNLWTISVVLKCTNITFCLCANNLIKILLYQKGIVQICLHPFCYFFYIQTHQCELKFAVHLILSFSYNVFDITSQTFDVICVCTIRTFISSLMAYSMMFKAKIRQNGTHSSSISVDDYGR